MKLKDSGQHVRLHSCHIMFFWCSVSQLMLTECIVYLYENTSDQILLPGWYITVVSLLQHFLSASPVLSRHVKIWYKHHQTWLQNNRAYSMKLRSPGTIILPLYFCLMRKHSKSENSHFYGYLMCKASNSQNLILVLQWGQVHQFLPDITMRGGMMLFN